MDETEYSKFQVEEVEVEVDVEEGNDEKEICCGLCCLQGCIWGILGAVYFFVVMPASIMLIMHGYNRSYPLTLGIGVVMAVGCTCGLPTGGYFVRRHRHRRKKRIEQYKRQRDERLTKAAYENDDIDVC